MRDKDREFESVLPFMDHLRGSVVELLSTGVQPAEALGRCMEVVLGENEPSRLDATDAIRRKMMEDIVYLVFNFTPFAQRDNDQRVFVAGMNCENVVEAEKALVDNASIAVTNSDKRRCELILAGAQDDEIKKNRMKNQWQKVWSDYSHLTTEGRREGRYTWNQFLLEAAERPQRLGVTIVDDPAAASCYAKLGAADGQFLGIPELMSEEQARVSALVELDETHGSRLRFEQVSAGVKAVHHSWTRCKPLHREALEAVPWAVFHLLRSYFRWGGDSFLSIPVAFGHGEADPTAVLSLATRGALNDRFIARWTLLAFTVFPPLLAREAVRKGEEAERVLAYETIGHTLKSAVTITAWPSARNRLRSLARAVPRATLSNEQCQQLLRTVLDEDRTPTPERVAQILNQAADSLANFAFAESLGGLIRLYGGLASGGGWDKFGNWIDEEALNRWHAGDTSLVDEYAKTIFEVGKLACSTHGWPSLRIEMVRPEGQDSPGLLTWRHDEGEHAVVTPRQISMPPFKKGSDAGFALLPAILEPLVNAAKTSADDRDRDASLPLEVHIHGNLPHGIRVEVGNPYSRAVNGQLSKGVRDTATLMNALSIASFDDQMTSQALSADRYIVWVKFTLTPHRLVERITQTGPSHVTGQTATKAARSSH